MNDNIEARLASIERKLDALTDLVEANASAGGDAIEEHWKKFSRDAMKKLTAATFGAQNGKAAHTEQPGQPVPDDGLTEEQTKTPRDVFHSDVFIREIPADVPIAPSGITGTDDYNDSAWRLLDVLRKKRGLS
jgi:hypothetical protein